MNLISEGDCRTIHEKIFLLCFTTNSKSIYFLVGSVHIKIKMVLKNLMIVPCFSNGGVFFYPPYTAYSILYIIAIKLFCIVSVCIRIVWSRFLLTREQLFVIPVAAEFGAISLLVWTREAFADPHLPVFATPGAHSFSTVPYSFPPQLWLARCRLLSFRASLFLACFIFFA